MTKVIKVAGRKGRPAHKIFIVDPKVYQDHIDEMIHLTKKSNMITEVEKAKVERLINPQRSSALGERSELAMTLKKVKEQEIKRLRADARRLDTIAKHLRDRAKALVDEIKADERAVKAEGLINGIRFAQDLLGEEMQGTALVEGGIVVNG